MVEDTTHPIEDTYHRGFLFKPSFGYARQLLSNKTPDQTNEFPDPEQIIFHDIVHCFLKDVNLVKDDK